MARGDARFAARAFIQFNFEGVLLAQTGCVERYQVAITTSVWKKLVTIMRMGKTIDRSQALLFREQRFE
jgi:hypothetical protein